MIMKRKLLLSSLSLPVALMALGNINVGAKAVNVKVKPLYNSSKTIQGRTLSNSRVKLTRYRTVYGVGTVRKNGQFKFT